MFEIALANQKNTLYLFLESCVCFGSRHYWCYSCKFQFSINCDSCIFRFLQSILCIMTCICTHNTRRKFQEHIRCQILFIWSGSLIYQISLWTRALFSLSIALERRDLCSYTKISWNVEKHLDQMLLCRTYAKCQYYTQLFDCVHILSGVQHGFILGPLQLNIILIQIVILLVMQKKTLLSLFAGALRKS